METCYRMSCMREQLTIPRLAPRGRTPRSIVIFCAVVVAFSAAFGIYLSHEIERMSAAGHHEVTRAPANPRG